MPIYEQTYRRYEARGPLRRVRFWPITREALRLILTRRAFLALLIVAWIPFVVQVGRIYLVTQFPQARRMLPTDAGVFGEFLNAQLGFAIILAIFGGSGLIANDLRTGAILVYLSRPLTRRDYVLGKLSVLLALILAVTLVPGLLLYGAALALAPEQFARWSLAWIAPAVVLHSATLALVVGLVALAVSSLSKSARVAGLGFFGLIVGLEIVQGVVWMIFRSPAASLISLQDSLRAVGHALFGVVARRADPHWTLAALVLLAASLACLAVLRSRVRAVEIVR